MGTAKYRRVNAYIPPFVRRPLVDNGLRLENRMPFDQRVRGAGLAGRRGDGLGNEVPIGWR